MSAAAKRWLNRVHELPCCLCMFRLGVVNHTAIHAHHCGEHRDDFFVASLCYEHHEGKTGVHGMHRASFRRLWKVDDQKLVAWTLRMHLEGSDGQESAF